MSIGWQLFIGYLCMFIISLVANYLLVNFLPGYFSEKGKNRATKEDIEDITGKIEGVKADYQREIEVLRSQLDRWTYRDKVAFEKEFEILTGLWNKVYELHVWTKTAQVANACPNQLTKQELREIESGSTAALQALSLEAVRYLPFYPSQVHDAIVKFLDATRIEGFSLPTAKPLKEDYTSLTPEDIQKLQNSYSVLYTTVCEVMRECLAHNADAPR
jgi:hypothetical protein